MLAELYIQLMCNAMQFCIAVSPFNSVEYTMYAWGKYIAHMQQPAYTSNDARLDRLKTYHIHSIFQIHAFDLLPLFDPAMNIIDSRRLVKCYYFA